MYPSIEAYEADLAAKKQQFQSTQSQGMQLSLKVQKVYSLESYKTHGKCVLTLGSAYLTRKPDNSLCYKQPYIVKDSNGVVVESSELCLMSPDLLSCLESMGEQKLNSLLKSEFNYPPDPAPMALEDHESYPSNVDDEDYSAKVKALDTMSFLYKNTNMTPESVAYVLETVYSALLKSNATANASE